MPKIPTAETLPVRGEKEILAALGDTPPDFTIEDIERDLDEIIIGENEIKLLAYIVATSRLLRRPLGMIVHGKSASGKTHVVNKIAALMPPEHVFARTRITPQALYDAPSLEHKFVVLGERSRVKDDLAADATAAARQLFSEGYINKSLAKSADNDTYKEQRGPIAYAETTTLEPDDIFEEDRNRMLLLRTNDSKKQTRAILTAQGRQDTDDKPDSIPQDIADRHYAFQMYLASLPAPRVVIPFAPALAAELPDNKIIARRMHPHIQSVIRVVAFINEPRRTRDKDERIVATYEDYDVAARVLAPIVARDLGTKLTDTQSKLYDTLSKRWQPDRQFTTAEAQSATRNVSQSSVEKGLKALCNYRIVDKVSHGRYRMTGLSPDRAGLPTAERLRELAEAKP